RSSSPERRGMGRRIGRKASMRSRFKGTDPSPRVLVLASDALFAMFFPPSALSRLEAVADWERFAERDESARLYAAVARADALVTTWHSPFLREELLADTPVRLIVHCGGEIASHIEPAVLDRITVVNTPAPMA